jgi:hypothetical protein
MVQWEYKIINIRSENYRLDPNAAPELNKLGVEGWELVSIASVNFKTGRDRQHRHGLQARPAGRRRRAGRGWLKRRLPALSRPNRGAAGCGARQTDDQTDGRRDQRQRPARSARQPSHLRVDRLTQLVETGLETSSVRREISAHDSSSDVSSSIARRHLGSAAMRSSTSADARTAGARRSLPATRGQPAGVAPRIRSPAPARRNAPARRRRHPTAAATTPAAR